METFKSDVYEDGRTKQAYKDETDISKILSRAAKGQTISHLAKHGAIYGDFTDIDDLLTAHAKLQKGMEIFQKLPGEVRREFHNDAAGFFKYVNDPANRDKLPELLPALAAPGTQMPTPVRTVKTELPAAATPAEPSPPEPPTA